MSDADAWTSESICSLPGSRETVYSFRNRSLKETLSLKIANILSPEYGLFVWPSAVVLADYIWSHKDQFRHKNVLELGSGVGLVGLVAASAGANCTLSDQEDKSMVLATLQRSVALNKTVEISDETSSATTVSVEILPRVIPFNWAQFNPEILSTSLFDLIISSDSIYDNPKDVEDFFATISFFMSKNPSLHVYMSYQIRSEQRNITSLCSLWDLSYEIVRRADSALGSNDTLEGSTSSDSDLQNQPEILIIRLFRNPKR